MKKFLKQIIEHINRVDSDTKHYEKASQTPAIPSQACVNMGVYSIL